MNTHSCVSVPYEVPMKLDSGSFKNAIVSCTGKHGCTMS